MTKLKSGVTLLALLLLATSSGADDTDVQSIDAIINAYYDVISGPKGHQYDAARPELGALRLCQGKGGR